MVTVTKQDQGGVDHMHNNNIMGGACYMYVRYLRHWLRPEGSVQNSYRPLKLDTSHRGHWSGSNGSYQ